MRLATRRPGLEPMLRPYVMCHIWAASLVPGTLIYPAERLEVIGFRVGFNGS